MEILSLIYKTRKDPKATMPLVAVTDQSVSISHSPCIAFEFISLFQYKIPTEQHKNA